MTTREGTCAGINGREDGCEVLWMRLIDSCSLQKTDGSISRRGRSAARPEKKCKKNKIKKSKKNRARSLSRRRRVSFPVCSSGAASPLGSQVAMPTHTEPSTRHARRIFCSRCPARALKIALQDGTTCDHTCSRPPCLAKPKTPGKEGFQNASSASSVMPDLDGGFMYAH